MADVSTLSNFLSTGITEGLKDANSPAPGTVSTLADLDRPNDPISNFITRGVAAPAAKMGLFLGQLTGVVGEEEIQLQNQKQ